MKKRSLLVVSLILVVMVLAGCASGMRNQAADKGSSEGDYPAPAAPAEEPEPGFSAGMDDRVDGGVKPDAEQASQVKDLAAHMGSKIIKSGYMSVETLHFEDTTSAIIRRVEQTGGFIASSNVQGWSKADAKYKPMRHARYKLRIPSERFEQFMTDVGELGNVTRMESWGDDVSAQYFDTEARLKSLTIQEERLLTILSRAEVLSDIIELERELSNIRYEIENLTGTLRKYDNLVAYSTLELEVQEVEEIRETEEKPVTLWDKIVRSFRNSIRRVTKIAEDLLILLVGVIPFLLLLAVILLVLFGLVKLLSRFGRKPGKQAQNLPSAKQEQNQNEINKEQ